MVASMNDPPEFARRPAPRVLLDRHVAAAAGPTVDAPPPRRPADRMPPSAGRKLPVSKLLRTPGGDGSRSDPDVRVGRR